MNRNPAETRGNFAVRACAGAGKTKTLVDRYFHRYVNYSGRMLAITFTEMAAGEMRSRIADELKKKAESAAKSTDKMALRHIRRLLLQLPDLEISTFHSFCRALIAEHASLLGLEPDFELLDATICKRYAHRAALDAVGRVVSGSTQLNAQESEIVNYLLSAVSHQTLLKLLRSVADKPGIIERFVSASKNNTAPFTDAQTPVQEASALCLLQQYSLKTLAEVENAKQGLIRIDGEPCALRTIKSNMKRGLLRVNVNDENEAREIAVAISISLPWLRAERYAQHERRLLNGMAILMSLVLDEYRQYKAGALDFEDLMYYAHKLLCSGEKRFEPVVGELRERFDHIFVDEFQDTDTVQWEIVRSLTQSGNGILPDKLFIVGDEQQAIYGFRGADVGNFAMAVDRMKEGEAKLSVNYRSTPEIISFCNAVFPHMFRSAEASQQDVAYIPMTANRTDRGEVVLLSVDGKEFEYTTACDLIEKLMRGDDSYPPIKAGEIAVIARKHHELEMLAPYLSQSGIPFSKKVTDDFVNSQVVCDIVALMSAVTNPDDDLAVVHLLRSPLCGLSDTALANSADGDTVYKRLQNGLSSGLFDERDAIAAKRAVSLINDTCAFFSTQPFDTAFAATLDLCGAPLAYAATPYAATALDSLEFLRFFASSLAAKGWGIGEFLESMKSGFSVDSGPASSFDDRVSLLTIHASKGLQFKTVVYLGAGNRMLGKSDAVFVPVPVDSSGTKVHVPMLKFDSEISSPDDDVPSEGDETEIFGPWRILADQERKMREQSEEIRLLYVAFTRARDRLYIVGSMKDKGKDFPENSPLGLVLSCLEEDKSRKSDIEQQPDENLFIKREHIDASGKLEFLNPVQIAKAFDSIECTQAIPEAHASTFARIELIAATELASRLANVRNEERTHFDDSYSRDERDARGMRFGIALHYLFEMMPQDPGKFVVDLVSSGKLLERETKPLLEAYTRLCENPAVRDIVSSTHKRVEWPFLVRIGSYVVRGKMDMVLFGKDDVKIVDFKSGAQPRDASVLSSYRYQLAIYKEAIKKSNSSAARISAFAVFSADGSVLNAADEFELHAAIANL